MPDLTTKYLGLTLKNPLVASSSPLCKDVSNILEMEDAGISAVVLHSLFEEQIDIESRNLDQFLSSGAESYAESLSYFPDMGQYNIGPDGYLEHIRKAKQGVDIPVIGSLNGISTGGWIRYAKLIEQAGADALELNIYFLPNNGTVSSAQVEQMYCDLVSHVKASVSIPIAVKLGPYFSSIPEMAHRLDAVGADGLVLFNRFYQPDIDLEAMEVHPALELSDSGELLLRLHWVAVLYGKIKADLAITGGVHTAGDVLKSMMSGARVAMTTSALLRHGIEYAAKIQQDLAEWMDEKEYHSIEQMQGSMSEESAPQPSAYHRANYMKVLSSYTA